MSPTERILGEEPPPDVVMEIVRSSLQGGEHILAVAATSTDGALVATELRVLVVEEEEVVFDSAYEDITDLKVRTGWWSRGITLKIDDGEAEIDIRDRDAAVTIGDIIGEHAPGVDMSKNSRRGGGLMSRARGVVDTATGQDIRKFEEFVEDATTVLVGVHRDQETLRGEVADMEESLRRRQDDINERLADVDEKVAEVREEIDDLRSSNASFMSRLVLVVSVVALVLSAVSIALRFV